MRAGFLTPATEGRLRPWLTVNRPRVNRGLRQFRQQFRRDVRDRIGFLPAGQGFDPFHPSPDVRVVLKRQFLHAVQVHRRRHGYVGDGRVAVAEPVAALKARFQDHRPRVENRPVFDESVMPPVFSLA